jgi:hypothetical protein
MNLNEAVMTTGFVMKNGAKIVHVHHSPECWEFYSDDGFTEADAMVVGLGEILRAHPEVESILWIPVNMEAFFISESGRWETRASAEE